jgi:hypothetical protein
MNENITPESDPLGELLACPRLPEDSTLQAKLRERTCRVLRWRRRGRHLAWAAALAACYAAGMLSPRLLPPAPPPAAPKSEPTVAHPKDQGALALEWQAFDNRERKGELYRAAGDRYLQEESDLESALRCYGAALDAGDDAARAVSSDDSWLLMVIKGAREKEKRHATSRD